MFFKKLFKKQSCTHDSYKMEADYSADPIWCKNCGMNLDIEDFPLSKELEEQLTQWVLSYGNWIDLDTDRLKENGVKLEKEHNESGMQLFEKVKQELGENYPIAFIPSNSAQYYSLKNKK